jgi:glucose-6-phosphate-specific signal transduction histidine kinase
MASFTVSVRPEAASVEIVDDGHGPAPEPGAPPDSAVRPGSGLAGLAERAAVIGGELTAGSRQHGPRQHGSGEHGGFRLRVQVPLDRPAQRVAAGSGRPVEA